ncbi:MAG TPA: metallophosphoesterase family protein, partial [Blastocatellia bacterium]|nr:metallophosphoesterase family protein [Blastocatellia bacterium]
MKRPTKYDGRKRSAKALRVFTASAATWLTVAVVGGTLILAHHGAYDAPLTVGLSRGPYLQLGTPTSVVVRWRTSVASDSVVRYGTEPGNLSLQANSQRASIEHEVTVSGLTPNTRYYYSVGTSESVAAGGDPDYYFVTAPRAGNAVATRIWVLGDSGTANSDAAAVRDAYYRLTGAELTNLWLMLGDNAYNFGADDEYQSAVFDMYPGMLRKAVLWPTLGNHDAAGSPYPPASLPYFNIFSLPMNAEAGGIASGSENYYSFDYGAIHLICLDSMASDRSPSGPMLTWLKSDLVSTARDWIIAFWHHPPYSRGSHNSDVEIELAEMRQYALPLLEAGGVDLVLTGHSHSYERSYLIDGHYGPSFAFTASMKRNGGDGRLDGGGAYAKGGRAPHEGAVYAVAGSSGRTGGGALNHPAMYISLNQLGSMILDINDGRLDARFLTSDGVVRDYFTITKPVVPVGPANLSATPSSGRIDLAWTDGSGNEDGFILERSIEGGVFSQIASVGPNVVS